MALATRELTVESSDSILSFGYHDLRWESDADGKLDAGYSNRYLAVDGAVTFDLGFPCASCTTLFQRVDQSKVPISPHEVSARLNAGLTELDDELVDTISRALPIGRYFLVTRTVEPQMVRHGDAADFFSTKYSRLSEVEHDPATEYFLLANRRLPRSSLFGSDAGFVEVAVPLYPTSLCDNAVVTDWEGRLLADAKPTALALSVPQVLEDREGHVQTTFVLTHFLLDGHHKMLAASRAPQRIQILAAINLEHRPKDFWSVDTIVTLLKDAER
jgi:hypothetical protein